MLLEGRVACWKRDGRDMKKLILKASAEPMISEKYYCILSHGIIAISSPKR
jgi:hypothetical protein